MKYLLKIVFRISIAFIALNLLTTMFGDFIPLEFSKQQNKEIFEGLSFFGVPIAILLTLTGTLLKSDPQGFLIGKVFLTVFIAVFSFIILTMALFSSMCTWTIGDEIFKNKANPEKKIVTRYFGCGATDSTPELCKLFIIESFTTYFIMVGETDTNKIDKSEWIRIERVNESSEIDK